MARKRTQEELQCQCQAPRLGCGQSEASRYGQAIEPVTTRTSCMLSVKASLPNCLLKGATGDEPAQHCLRTQDIYRDIPQVPQRQQKSASMIGTLKAPALTSLT